MTTLTITNAIIHIGNVIGAAVGGGSAPNGEAVSKVLGRLKEMLYPGEADRLAEKAERIKALLEKEVAKGPLKIKLVGGDSRKDKARRRRRR